MSQASRPAATAVAPAAQAPAAAPAPGTVAPQAQSAPPAYGAQTSIDTPQRLRLLSLAVVVTGIVVGTVGALIFSFLAYSLYRAEADTAQLIRVQQIQTNLLTADATATNGFLVGGLAPPAQRATYDQAIAAVSALITESARAQPADAEALAALNQQVVSYTSGIEQARANNRQGLPVGGQYLRVASAQLRADALPILDNLVSANAERARDRMATWIGLVFVFIAALGLAAVVVGQVWLARRFRRTINRGMLASAIVLVLVLVGGGLILFNLTTSVRAIESGSFSLVRAAADARIDANNAKSNESLALIARGSGAAFETAWKASAESVVANLGSLEPQLTDDWNRYASVHTEIRALDDGGKWDEAVALATGTGPDSANTAFNAFDANLADTLDQASQDASAGLSGLQPGLVVAALLIFVAGLGSALLGRWGVAARLREYR